MAIKLFGFTIGQDKDKLEAPLDIQSFTLPDNDDAAATIASSAGAYGQYLDLEGNIKNEAELITKYREMALYPEAELAIDDIVNEAIIMDDRGKPPVSIVLDRTPLSTDIKKKIRDEFDNLISLLDFNDYAYDIFRRWYIDGRLYYHIMIDTKNPKQGIYELRPIDPRQIKKVREVKDPKQNNTAEITAPEAIEYFIFNPQGMQGSGQGLRIAPDSIAYVHSGILNSARTMVLSHLHKAIKPLNQLRMLEDATVIYRISRAPERRIFYIDVGNLPKLKAEQYLKGIMNQYKNKIVYDATTGEIRDDRKFMSMLEDYWLPRREGGRGTEITTLPGGTNLGEIEDIIYFQKKLYKSLGIPVSRLEPEGTFSLGRATEINRDEVKFTKFISRIRKRFSLLFDDLLETQLRLKGVLTREDWLLIKDDIQYNYINDSHFAELKLTEMLREKLEIVQTMEEYIGKYYSNEWVRKNVLGQTDADIAAIQAQIDKESEQPEGDDGDEEGEDSGGGFSGGLDDLDSELSPEESLPSKVVPLYSDESSILESVGNIQDIFEEVIEEGNGNGREQES
jgi:hypothetical protein